MSVKEYEVICCAANGLRWGVIEYTDGGNAREVARFYYQPEAADYVTWRGERLSVGVVGNQPT